MNTTILIKKILSIIIVFSFSFLSASCHNPESSDFDDFIRVSEEENGAIPFSNIHGIDIQNFKGGAIIYGTTITDTIFYVLSKTIIAKTREIAEIYFDEISLDYHIKQDTLRLSVLYPFDTDDLNSIGYIDMYVPHNLPCTIYNMIEGIYTFYLASDIIVRKAKDHIIVNNHSGSCDVETEKGSIQMEIALPDSGYCIAKTDNGDIKLTIPQNTSANIYAKTNSGLITSQNPDILDLMQTSNSLTGILGTGNGEIRLETNIGNISIEILDID